MRTASARWKPASKPKFYLGTEPLGFRLSPGDLIVTMTDLSKVGDTLGYSAIVPEGEYLHNQRIGLVEVTEASRIDKRFLGYLLRSPTYRAHVLATATGSTVRHTSPNRILDFIAEVPALAEQRAIADVLTALDDKIAANRELCRRCGNLAAALFAEVPSRDGRLGDVAEITMGQSPPGATYNSAGAGLPFYQGTRDFGFRSPSTRVWCSEPKRMAERRDVLIGVRAPVGALNVATERCAIGRGIAAARSRTHPSALFQALAADTAKWRPFEQEGTVFGAIRREQLRDIPIAWPAPPALDVLERRLSALDDRLLASERETDKLLSLRDSLLPKLLSGEVHVMTGTAFDSEAAS